jgi:hypothetical protein
LETGNNENALNTIEPVDDVCAKTGARFMQAPVEAVYSGGMPARSPGIMSFLFISMGLYFLRTVLFFRNHDPLTQTMSGAMTGGLILAYLAYRRSTEDWSWADFGFIRPSLGDAGVGLLAGAASIASNIVCGQAHLMPSAAEFNRLPPEIASKPLLAAACMGLIWLAFAEECIFRGYLIPALKTRYGMRTAVLLSSALFGLVHLQFAVPTFVVGIIFSAAFLQRRSLWASLIAHFTHNTAVTLVGYFLLERAVR